MSSFVTAHLGRVVSPEKISSTLSASCQPVALDDIRRTSTEWIWSAIYEPRIASLEGCLKHPAPCLFPGQWPALLPGGSNNRFALDRARALAGGQFFADKESFKGLVINTDVNSWNWQFLKRQQFKEVSCESQSVNVAESKILHLVQKVQDVTSLRSLFNLIHSCWSSVEFVDYPNIALQIALTTLSQNSRRTLEVAFELEEFASYCALRSNYLPMQSTHFEGKWVDIGYRDPSDIRASERCIAKKVLSELENLPLGKTAPLLVNEFDCVADGNHRLTASRVWNALHAANDDLWEPGNVHFEKRLFRFFNKNASVKSDLSASNALESLSEILSEEESKQRINKLRRMIGSHVIRRIPILPVLSYSGVAIDRRLYENGGVACRFNPSHYQILKEDSSTCLAAKACYHRTDTLPLPLFYVLEARQKDFSDKWEDK